MHVVFAALLATAAQSPEDLGAGAPLAGPSAADLGVDNVVDDVVDDERGERPASVDEPAAVPAVVLRGDPSERAHKLRDDVDAALGDLGTERKALHQRLEAVASASAGDSVYAVDPALKALHRLTRAKALALAGRFDDADDAVRDASRALEAVAASLETAPMRRLQAAVRFHAAFVVEGRARADLARPVCGAALGLRRLAQDEARARRKRLDDVAAAYLPVTRGPDRFWGRRAAFQVAALYEEIARTMTTSSSLRAESLPAPYALDVIDTAGLLEPALNTWLGELRRSYGELQGAVDARDPDPELATRARERAAALVRYVPEDRSERVENPWMPAFHEGLVRVARRPERRNGQGRFVPIDTRSALAAMTEALAHTGDVDNAYALVGLSVLAPEKLPVAPVLAALAHADDRVVVAGLIAATALVAGDGGAARAAALREAVLAAYASSPAEARKAPFMSAQSALFGRVERALLALQAIARIDRDSADQLARDERLPVVERAWLLAELADGRFAAQFDSWAWDKDERVAGLAIYGGVTARRSHAGYLLRHQVDGLVGCASRAASEPVDVR